MMDNVLKLLKYLLCIAIGIFFVLGIFEGFLNLSHFELDSSIRWTFQLSKKLA